MRLLWCNWRAVELQWVQAVLPVHFVLVLSVRVAGGNTLADMGAKLVAFGQFVQLQERCRKAVVSVVAQLGVMQGQ